MTEFPEEHVCVAIIGAGPAGIGAAIGLAKRGVGPVIIFERCEEAGGIPAKYPAESGGVPTYMTYTRGRVVFGQQFVAELLAMLGNCDVDLRLESTVTELDAAELRLTVVDPTRGKHVIRAKTIVMTTGAREQTFAERGWLSGERGGRIFQTLQLLELFEHYTKLDIGRPAVVGSDLIAYAVAAKLSVAGNSEVIVIDDSNRPRAWLPARLFFRRWVQPNWHHAKGLTFMKNSSGGYEIKMMNSNCNSIHADTLFVSGNLMPNTELIVSAGIAVKPLTNTPAVSSGSQLSVPGCFIAGNVSGGSYGGQRCYFNGLGLAKAVVRFLKRRKS